MRNTNQVGVGIGMAMAIAQLMCGCSRGGDCAPGEVPNAALQACVIPKTCAAGTLLNERNECVDVADASRPDAASVDAGLGQTTSSDTAEAAGSGGMEGNAATHSGGPTAGSSGASATADPHNPSTASAGSSAGAGASGVPSTGGAGGMKPACGDGVIEMGEACDGNCPTKDSCKSTNACLVASFSGDASSCDAKCDLNMIAECKSGDGCCAPGCDYATDTDCSKSCGDGVVTAPETCEPTSKKQPCPTSCDDGNACTTDVLTGAPAQCNVACSHATITAAMSGDGCCPTGANATNDSDCKPVCGDGVVEMGETCDGNCPTSCDDGNACTMDTLTGTAAQCNVVCNHMAITAAVSGDGCCPSGANATTDSDCKPSCGNGVTEAGETCDGSCPTSCGTNNGCMTSVLAGSASKCNAVCTPSTITTAKSGDGCCPTGANSTTDSDCSPTCGNGVVESGEECELGAASKGGDNLAAGAIYDAWTCDGALCTRRYIYTPCSDDSQCGSAGKCNRGRCTFACDSNAAVTRTPPDPNGHNCVFPNGRLGLCFTNCLLKCDTGTPSTNQICPDSLACTNYDDTSGWKICGL